MQKEEIKEILDNFKNNYDELGSCYYPEDILGPEDLKLLYDYITNLQEKYNKALELLVDFNMPCERDDFNLLDTDYCELNCSVDDEQYKKCWNKFIEWRLQGVDKE